jgi:predicted GTPase
VKNEYYERFIVNKLRQEFGFRGTPIRMFVREREDKNND